MSQELQLFPQLRPSLVQTMDPLVSLLTPHSLPNDLHCNLASSNIAPTHQKVAFSILCDNKTQKTLFTSIDIYKIP